MTDPARPWAQRSHAELAELARELLMCGHLIDRSGMPHAIGRLGREGMTEVAIGEWMGASPIYAKRMQRLLGFEGETVETTFKGMQLDIGAPPEFLDFRYTVIDDHHGEFHLDHCGALMDVEPMGDECVHAMCHTIEDPTFDATATAANPRAQVRPVHRPPRVPADRHPHCAWTVTIDLDADALEVPAQAVALARSAAAQLPLAVAEPSLPDDDGWNDYAARLDPDLVMERFSSAALSRICDEVALQGQLVARSYLVEMAERVEPDEIVALGTKQAVGITGLATKRIAAAIDAAPTLAGLAEVLAVHPMLAPRTYVDLHLVVDGDALVVELGPCPGRDEVDGLSWPGLLAGPTGDAILSSAITCLIPTARVVRLPQSDDDGTVRWRVDDDPARPPAEQPNEVTLTEFSSGATFTFERRG